MCGSTVSTVNASAVDTKRIVSYKEQKLRDLDKVRNLKNAVNVLPERAC